MQTVPDAQTGEHKVHGAAASGLHDAQTLAAIPLTRITEPRVQTARDLVTALIIKRLRNNIEIEQVKAVALRQLITRLDKLDPQMLMFIIKTLNALTAVDMAIAKGEPIVSSRVVTELDPVRWGFE
jgi:hypothetical protein